jgi:murein DD-endopeptidase MepM/ murein hydrolase activator NlpD
MQALSRNPVALHRSGYESVRIAVAILVLLFLGCNIDSPIDVSTNSISQMCGGYSEWESSEYVLPFPVGKAHRVSQGNCTRQSHQRTLLYSYDLEMPFGSVVTAARDGIVMAMRVTQPTGSRGLTASNWLQVQHEDGIASEYIHLEQFGNLVDVGDMVTAGDPVAITGDTGDVGAFAHVHFDIIPCGSNFACNTLPVTFRNTTPNPNGLIENVIYEALPY